jgi:hypothetical protein
VREEVGRKVAIEVELLPAEGEASPLSQVYIEVAGV